ncbi:DUF1349 domain-containing protein [Paenibacillus sp. IB182496]|uniref:DUF1349 domain-containing protein n=1 Tax=Paenibacillus sabuli TaxID=2772509 RepID=A0A927GQ97_9BACL|nr:DUF1349 domain-containing protein [Paenibacillus sabuli]MBD2844051.1 DUF1349 domain-containing protein [Paenibacillus sabuli]
MKQRMPVHRFLLAWVLLLSLIITPSFSPSAYAAVPSGWNSQDIGSVGLAGSTSYSGGVFTLAGSGTDIVGSSDQFHFAYYALTGDGSITARIVSQQNTHAWAKAGVMMRDSLTPNSAFIAQLATPTHGVRSAYRTTAYGGVSDSSASATATVPVWLKITRSGNTFTTYLSADGVNWGSATATQTIAMATTIYVGLAVTSHNNSATGEATFSNVSNPSGGGGDPGPGPGPGPGEGSGLPKTFLNRSMGINLDNPRDSSNLKLFANAFKTIRFGSPSNPTDNTNIFDSNGDPNQDFSILLWDGNGYMSDTEGSYAIQFNGQATVSITIGNASLSAISYNASTNTSTGVLTVHVNSTVALRFLNTKRTSSSSTNTGITNVKIMRPISKGSTTSYPTSAVFTNPIVSLIANNFDAIRYMDFTATNGKTSEAQWSDRVRPALIQTLKGTTGTGWQGRGGSWEYAVMLSNATNTDMWINVPVAADDDYLTKLAQLIKYGSDGVNPYTSVQSNPIYPPLNSSLNVYVEYANELWNYASAFSHSNWNMNAAVAEVSAGGSNLNYDGMTSTYQLGWRRQARRTVEISNAFRSVFGDSAMMSRVRPVLEWKQANNQDTAGVMLNFLDNWYNNADGNHVANPRAVNDYIWGGSGSAYYNPDNSSDTLTLSNIWTSKSFNPATWINGQTIDASYAAAFGLHRTAYEGGPSMDYSGHSEAVKEQAWNHSGMKTNIVDHQNTWENAGGELLMYFNLTGSSYTRYYEWEFVKNMLDPINTSPKMQGIQQLIAAAKQPVTIGASMPGSINGNNWSAINRSWGTPGSGSLNLNGNDLRWAAYNFKGSGNRAAKVDYSSGGAATARVYVDGNLAGTITTSGGAGSFTATSQLFNDGLHSVRVVVTSGSLSIVNVSMN